MNLQEYSIVIRTLGTAGCKYKALLDSICKQSFPPKEIIVVIPHGYELPSERLGYENFVRSEKGMVIQRTVGLDAMSTDLGLFLDDDLSFDSEFAKTLIDSIEKYQADVVFPILPDLLPSTLKQKLFSFITLAAIPFKSKKWYTKIYRNGSYGYCCGELTEASYNAMTAPGACFLARKKSFESISFEDERWLEKTHYALPDDQVMFYKFYLCNKTVKGITTCNYIHLDAGGQSNDRAKIAAYSLAKNKMIFWHRFIYLIDMSKISRCISLVCYVFTLCFKVLILIICSVLGKNHYQKAKEAIKGIIDGYKFLKTSDYKQLQKVK